MAVEASWILVNKQLKFKWYIIGKEKIYLFY